MKKFFIRNITKTKCQILANSNEYGIVLLSFPIKLILSVLISKIIYEILAMFILNISGVYLYATTWVT